MKSRASVCTRGHAAAIAAVFVATFLPSAHASTRRDDTTDIAYTSLANADPYASVGAILWSGFGATGVLITPKFVLTAAHVVDDAPTRTINIGGATSSSGTNYTDVEHYAHPSWDTPSNGNDIGLMRLGTAVAGITPALRFFGANETGNVGTWVGFGNTGTGSSGQVLNTYGTKRAVQNMIDALGNAYGASVKTSIADFDDPDNLDGLNGAGGTTPLALEGLIATGDSGGGLFANIGGVEYLVGIHSAIFALTGSQGDGFANASYSDLSLDTRVNQHNIWIDDSISVTWNSSASGNFATGGNWALGPSAVTGSPDGGDVVGFKNSGSYTITFSSSVSNWMLLARGGNVTTDLAGHTWNLTNTTLEGGMVIARYSGNVATVTLANGTVNANDAMIAQLSGNFGRLVVGNNATLNINGKLYVGGSFTGIGGNGGLIVNSPTARANINYLKVWNTSRVEYNSGSLSVGTLEVAGTVSLSAGGDKTLRTQSINLIGAGVIQLADNDLIVDYTGASPLASIRSYLITGRNGGNWLGQGITSSKAASSPNPGESGPTALGVGEASLLGITSFGGYALDATTVLVKYTYEGDANLDGVVDIGDLARLATSWQVAGSWINGDFDYSGFIDITDLAMLATNWQAGVGAPLAMSFEMALASVGLSSTIVPEPVALGAICTALGMLRRRVRGTRKPARI